ncbi:MAG: hypothetical protein INR71_05675 [Terriglobus roseus]|nr:hypothetical protein [Terriglobus roseus]
MTDAENTAAPAEQNAPVSEVPAANGAAAEAATEAVESEAAPATEKVEVVAAEVDASADDADAAKPAEEESKTANGATKRKATEGSDADSKRPRKATRSDYNKNVKTDYSQLEESSDPDEIRKQVEFYFSDSNLPMDTYLFNLVGGSENKSVPVKVIHSFKRMRRFQPYSAVAAAIKDSDILDIFGDAGKEEIRRKQPLEERGEKTDEQYYKAFEDKTMPRSIYAKGFGQEGATTQLDLEEFFAPYGPINSVRMRRTYPDKLFKGSVFVEFDGEEGQTDFLALDPKPTFNGKELLIMSKKAYVDMKSEDIRQGKIKPNEHRPRWNSGKHERGGRGGGRGGRGGRDRDGGRDGDDWKGRRDDFQKGRGRGSKRGRGNRGDDDDGVIKCYSCGEPGHRKSDCPKGRLARGGEGGDTEKPKAEMEAAEA